MLAIYITAAILLIILFLLFKKFIFTILFENNIVVVKLHFWGIDFNVYRLPLDKKDHQSEPVTQKKKLSFREIWRKIKKCRRIYRDQKGNFLLILSKAARVAKLHEYNVEIDYGFGNAAITGIAYGAIYGVAVAADTVFRNSFGYQADSALRVKPNYNDNKFMINSKFVASVRIISLIKLCLYSLKIYQREKTRVLKIWEED